LAIIHKNFDGNLGLAFNSHPAEGVSTPENIHYPTYQDRRDKVFRHYIDEIVSATDECKYQMERLDLTQAISALMDGMYAFSAHITNWQPWKTLKEDQQLGRHQLDVLFQMLTVLVRGFYPFVPGSVEKIWYLMGHSAESLAPGLQFSNKWMPAAAPNMLPPLVPVFPRLEIPEAADA
jgi:methionyl-tRNA synthetase